jgi:hypothetical protein
MYTSRELKNVPCSDGPGKFAPAPPATARANASSLARKACNIAEPVLLAWILACIMVAVISLKTMEKRRQCRAPERRQPMRNQRAKFRVRARSSLILAALAMAIVAAGCSHRVVANPDEHTVKVFPDQATYDKVAKMKSQGGAMGMLGGIGANLAAKEIDDQTPVRIVTSNDEGSVVEVTDGPFKGVTGFVPRQNVN